MDATFALTQPVLAVNAPTAADLLLTFRADAPGGGGAAARPPVYVSLVIDRSGSMSGKPLKHALAAAELLVRSLRPQDVVSVVVYDDKVDTIVDPQPVGDGADGICKALRKVKTAGATNLHGGWAQGCKHVLNGGGAAGGRRAVRRVLLLTDGQANVGIKEPKKLIAEAREQAERGVVTTTLGFGRSFNEDLLIGMAEAAGGNFYYIETPEDAGQVFLIEGESLTSVAGQNLTVTLTPAEGVRVRDVLNNYPSRTDNHGVVQVQAGDVYGGEDKLLAVELEIAPQGRANGNVPLVTVAYAYDPVGPDAAGRAEARLDVAAPVAPPEQARAATPDPDVVRQVTRIRIARAKEAAVAYADAGNHAAAADVLRRLAADLRGRGLEEDFETAEEMAQLEHFAETIERKQLDAGGRKVMRDQSYQGRTRSRADLAGRGSAGGSAQGLEAADTAAGGVELVCVRDGGKLRVQVVSDGYDPHFNVQFPRSVREEGVRYVVDRLETSKDGTFYRAVGKVRRLTGPSSAGAAATSAAAAGAAAGTSAAPPSGDPADPLGLAPLFAGGGEPWVPLLKPVIEAQPNAAAFIGPGRDKGIVPVRELTFQALKPNPPERWKVVIFGQNPYPRVESATGIAMFDNTFGNWKDSQFGKVTSIRCIIKAATMWKHGIPKQTGIADIRALLAREQTVQPPEWFQAMLTQGVLLLNAALTAASDGSRSASTDQHTAFWRPVVERIVEEILKAKQAATDKAHKGVVFAWWGAHARNLRRIVEALQKKYPGVRVRHIDHPNPAAQGDIFCDGHHFADVNAELRALDVDEVDWLPAVGWNKAAAGPAASTGQPAAGPSEADRMGDFIAKTMELHKFYLDRLAAVKDEGVAGLPPVVGVLATPLVAFGDAVAPLVGLLKGLDPFARRSADYARQKAAAGTGVAAVGGLSEHEVAAVYLYTCESVFYKQVNAALRDADREKVRPYFPYLRLLFSAFGKLKAYAGSLWRGVAADLRPQYPKGGTVTWWGVSSCTSKMSVAMGFMGSTGKRTLFEIRPASAVGIKQFSAFTGEEEYLMPPGTQLKVTDVKAERTGLYTVKLEEVAGERLVR